MTLKVIGAGVGRTGTYSLKLALEQLGLGPCHHMDEVLKNPPVNVPIWHAAALGKPDWDAAYKGYNAAVDWPTAAFWHELIVVYPAAKVILSTRSVASWYASFSETIFKLMLGKDNAPPQMRPFLAMAAAVLGRNGFTFPQAPEDIRKAFMANEEAVKKEVPADRLLVFDVKQGWEPLCKFMGMAVPDTPFPRSNDQKEFWDRIKGGAA